MYIHICIMYGVSYLLLFSVEHCVHPDQQHPPQTSPPLPRPWALSAAQGPRSRSHCEELAESAGLLLAEPSAQTAVAWDHCVCVCVCVCVRVCVSV